MRAIYIIALSVFLAGCNTIQAQKTENRAVVMKNQVKDESSSTQLEIRPVLFQASFIDGSIPILSVATNLPTGFKIIAHIRDSSVSPPVVRREEIVVRNNRADLDLFWTNRQAYQMKDISIHFGSPDVSEMSESVQKILGRKGENLIGRNTTEIEGKRYLDYYVNFKYLL